MQFDNIFAPSQGSPFERTADALEKVIAIARSRANPYEGIAVLVSGSLSGLLTAFSHATPHQQGFDTADLVELLKLIVARRLTGDDPRVRFLQDLETGAREEAQRLRDSSVESRN